MKKLHLIRHAKSSWADPELKDKQRPLNKRGIKACGLMARPVLMAAGELGTIFCSPAVRTQQTIELIDKTLKKNKLHWQLDNRLYTFDPEELLIWCQQLNDTLEEVTVVAHNPALTDLVNWLTDCKLDNIPTCAYVQLGFDGDSWQDLSENSCELLALLKPKMYTT